MKRPLAILMNPDGTPAEVGLAVRPSENGYGRAKATFIAELVPGSYIHAPGGAHRVVPADAPVAVIAALSSEFRLELTN